MTIYVLIGDISDEDEGEEPFDKERLEGVFSSLKAAETYIVECVNEDAVLNWQPKVTFEHVPYLQSNNDFKVYIETLDEGNWRRMCKTFDQATEGSNGNMNVNTLAEVERLSAMFAEALGLSVQEFNERH